MSKGFPESSAREIVDYVGPGHENFEYRYMQEGASYEVKPLLWIFDKLSDLDNVVDGEIGASAAHNKRPGGRWTMTDRVLDWRPPI